MTQREEMQGMMHRLLDGVAPYYSEGKAFLKLGTCGFHYTERGSWIEAFSRILWGFSPLIAGGGSHPLMDTIITGLTNGTNPEHLEYWGEVEDGDQKIVEMASISYSILLGEDIFYNKLSPEAQQNLCAWLDKSNHHVCGDTNWNFFRVLVDLALDKVGYAYDPTMRDQSLENIEKLYREEGWYQDGENSAFDYYNPFAFHYYALIYYRFNRHNDPERAERYKQRVLEFAPQALAWVDERGSSLPYGRSLQYRFAQIALFSLAAVVDVEILPWDVCRKTVMSNLRYWFSQKIFDRDDVLTVGYAYPNLIMSESYNAPGGCYWGLKVFAALAASEDHPFWSTPDTTPKLEDGVTLQKVPGFLMQRIENGDQVVALSNKQYRTPERCYYTASFVDKYAKFAYSTKFGFSVGRGHFTLEEGAFDSMLAVREVGQTDYAVRNAMKLIYADAEKTTSRWSPLKGVTIETTLIPKDGWHIRIHKIKTPFELETAEGGFSARREEETMDNQFGADAACAWTKNLTDESMIFALEGEREGCIIKTEPNTNLLFTKTYLPMLCRTLPAGETTLVTAVLAGSQGAWLEAEKAKLQQLKEEFV